MKKPILKVDEPDAQYQAIFGDVSKIIDAARRSAAQSVNAIMTAAYWRIGQRIIEFERSGEKRAKYAELIKRLAADLTQRFGRGFGPVNLSHMKRFYLLWPAEWIFQTPSEKLEGGKNFQTASEFAGQHRLAFSTSLVRLYTASIGLRTRTPVDSTKPRHYAAVLDQRYVIRYVEHNRVASLRSGLRSMQQQPRMFKGI